MSKILFVCSTPYQILSALKIKALYYDRETADLLLTDAVRDIKNWIYEEKLKKYFCNVFQVEIYEYAKKNICNYDVNVNYEDLNLYIEKELAFLSKEYMDIFVANTHSWVINWIMNYDRCNAKHTIKYHYFDDGIYSYISFDSRIVAGYIKFEDAYLYEEDLICTNYDIPIRNISVRNSSSNAEFQEVFVNGDLNLDAYELVLLEHHFSDKKYYELQDEIFDILYAVNPLNTVLKPHHRRRKRGDSKIHIMNSLMPFEVMLQKSNTSLSLITVFSTAVLLAPFIATRPLKLIFIYRLFKDYFSQEEYIQMERFIKKLAAKFKDKHQIIIPDTYEEICYIFGKVKENE